jgi:serine/threonine protein kinase
VGVDWAALADALREGKAELDPPQRIALCRGLAQLVQALEAAQCAHRDLSSSNVFIEPATLALALIDFDSLFHPSLTMPANTTCGTLGYTAPWAWRQDQLSGAATWSPAADRYALAILCAEFLLMDVGAALTAEGGMFDQDELRARQGPGVSAALARLVLYDT